MKLPIRFDINYVHRPLCQLDVVTGANVVDRIGGGRPLTPDLRDYSPLHHAPNPCLQHTLLDP